MTYFVSVGSKTLTQSINIFGSTSAWLQSFLLDLAKSTWFSYISVICGAFSAFGNYCKQKTLLFYNLLVLCIKCIQANSLHTSKCHIVLVIRVSIACNT